MFGTYPKSIATHPALISGVVRYTNSPFAIRNSQLKNLDAAKLSGFTSVSDFCEMVLAVRLEKYPHFFCILDAVFCIQLRELASSNSSVLTSYLLKNLWV